MQHGAGFILFEDVRRYAAEQMDPELAPHVRAAVEKGIDDAVYGLMMVLDGVTGALSGSKHRLELGIAARLVRLDDGRDEEVIAELDLSHGDGMCMGFHGWRTGDFGEFPVVLKRTT
jgi:hypothetical protein